MDDLDQDFELITTPQGDNHKAAADELDSHSIGGAYKAAQSGGISRWLAEQKAKGTPADELVKALFLIVTYQAELLARIGGRLDQISDHIIG